MFSMIESPLARIALLLLSVAAIGGGIVLGVNMLDHAAYQRGQSACQAAQLTKARRAELAEQAKVDAQNRNLLRLSEQLITAKATIDAQTARLQERAHDVSTQYRAQPDAALQPVPGWIVTRGWVCDYNRAIGYSLPGAAAAVGGDAATSCAADAFAASDVTGEQILRNHEEYGAYCRKLEKQVNVLLDDREFLERQGNP